MTHNPDVDTLAGAGPGRAAALGPGTSDGARKTLNAELKPATSGRVWRSWALRTRTAGHDAFAAAPAQIDNGDEALYADKSGTYTKGVLQSGVAAWSVAIAEQRLKNALSSGAPANSRISFWAGHAASMARRVAWRSIWSVRTPVCFVVPPAPALASEAYATELVELYWASLLRDVAFTDYPPIIKSPRTRRRNCRRCKRMRARGMPPTRSRRSCFFVVICPERRSVPTSHSFCCSPRNFGALPIMYSNISPTRKKATAHIRCTTSSSKTRTARPLGRASCRLQRFRLLLP